MKFDSYIFTSAGGRDENQDSAFAEANGNRGIFVVADGLGGHLNGREASDICTRTFAESWAGMPINAPADVLKDWIVSLVSEANRRIMARQAELRSNMRTTVVALAVDGNRCVWANTGDSRLYYIHNSDLAFVTEDHSVAFLKYKAGEITRAQIGRDDDQSRLLRALGSDDSWKPDVHYQEGLQPGDAFVLCCDGMWENITDEEVLVDSLKSDSPEEYGENLLLRAMSRIQPENDNLTVLTMMVRN